MNYREWYDRYVNKTTEAEYNSIVKGAITSDNIKITNVSGHAVE